MKLSRKRRLFVEEYLQCWNATEAARRVGYKHPNVQGPRLLVNDSIRAVIEARLREKAMAADEVLYRLGEMARADPAEFLVVTEGGGIRLSADAFRSGRTWLIKSLKETKEGYHLTMHDAQAALQLIGRHYALFTDAIEHRGEVGLRMIPLDWGDEDDSGQAAEAASGPA